MTDTRGLTQSMPRAVSLSVQGVVVACMAMVMVAGGVLLGAWLYVQSERLATLDLRLQREGATTTGQVLEIGPRQGEDQRRKVNISYEVDGRTLRRTVNVRSGARLKVGARVEVCYLRSEPDRSWIAGSEPQHMPSALAPLVGATLALPAALIFCAMRRQRFLLEEGGVAPGSVTKIRRVHGGHGVQTQGRYEFRTLNGKSYTGSFKGHGKGLPEGTVITVLYDRDNPKRNGRYPFPLVKLADW